MYRPSKFFGEHSIDSLVALYLPLAGKLISDQDHFKMGLGPCRYRVHKALISDLQHLSFKLHRLAYR